MLSFHQTIYFTIKSVVLAQLHHPSMDEFSFQIYVFFFLSRSEIGEKWCFDSGIVTLTVVIGGVEVGFTSFLVLLEFAA